MVHAGLPASFWADAVSTAAYLFVRLPSSALPKNVTAFEMRKGRKPNLNLRGTVWGCQAYILLKKEQRKKGGPKGYEAIFVSYPKNFVGWIVRDLKGAYHTVNHVIFNESSPGKLSSKSSFLDVPFQTPDTDGNLLIALQKPKCSLKNDLSPTGLIALQAGYQETLDLLQSTRFLHTSLPLPSPSIIADFSALFCLEQILPTQDDTFESLKAEYVTPYPTAFLSFNSSKPRTWDLSKPPATYHEALARPDSDRWKVAMGEEMAAMKRNEVFEETT
ncbi:hypothetical protein BDZ89DRAFT_1026805 [Hymenopellis radicata]|nr:hypothetical protein BDZ89DRAFT_1026805 [Hymenopellis radicata]